MNRFVLALCLALPLAGCGGDRGQGAAPAAEQEVAPTMATLSGTAFYRERILLPPGVELEVQLQDVSLADAPAKVLASVSMNPENAPPWSWSLQYDESAVDERMRYGLRATVRQGDKLLFTTTEAVDPFRGDSTDLLLRSVARAPAAQLQDTVWQLHTLNGEEAGAGAGGRRVDLLLESDSGRASGFSGCNRYTGGFTVEQGDDGPAGLSFGPAAGTMMACPEGMELEREYLQALARVTGFRLRGDNLALLDGDTVLATFKAQ